MTGEGASEAGKDLKDACAAAAATAEELQQPLPPPPPPPQPLKQQQSGTKDKKKKSADDVRWGTFSYFKFKKISTHELYVRCMMMCEATGLEKYSDGRVSSNSTDGGSGGGVEVEEDDEENTAGFENEAVKDILKQIQKEANRGGPALYFTRTGGIMNHMLEIYEDSSSAVGFQWEGDSLGDVYQTVSENIAKATDLMESVSAVGERVVRAVSTASGETMSTGKEGPRVGVDGKAAVGEGSRPSSESNKKRKAKCCNKGCCLACKKNPCFVRFTTLCSTLWYNTVDFFKNVMQSKRLVHSVNAQTELILLCGLGVVLFLGIWQGNQGGFKPSAEEYAHCVDDLQCTCPTNVTPSPTPSPI